MSQQALEAINAETKLRQIQFKAYLERENLTIDAQNNIVHTPTGKVYYHTDDYRNGIELSERMKG